MATSTPTCDCCGRSVPARDWDFLYHMCGDCAWCHSLHEFSTAMTDEPFCHHGACRQDSEGRGEKAPATGATTESPTRVSP